MKKKAWVSIVAALLALGGAQISWQAWHAAQAHSVALARERTERAALVAEADRLAQQVQDAERRLAQARGTVEKLIGPSPAGAAGSAAPSVPSFRSTPAASDPPEAHAAAIGALKAGLPLKYGAFYRAAGFNTEQVAKFEALVVEHDGRVRDIRAVEAGIKIDRATAVPRDAITIDGQRVQVMEDPSIATLRKAEEARFQQAQIALLGEAGYAQLQQFDQGAESRTFVADLVGNLALVGAPLSFEQGEQLTQAFQKTGFRTKIEPQGNDWASLAAQARPLLSPAQYAEFEAQLARVRVEVAGRAELIRSVREWRK